MSLCFPRACFTSLSFCLRSLPCSSVLYFPSSGLTSPKALQDAYYCCTYAGVCVCYLYVVSLTTGVPEFLVPVVQTRNFRKRHVFNFCKYLWHIFCCMSSVVLTTKQCKTRHPPLHTRIVDHIQSHKHISHGTQRIQGNHTPSMPSVLSHPEL